MDLLLLILDIILHLDHYSAVIVESYGLWTYLFIFLIIFMETGIVVTPFLPGDSLLFAAGSLSATTIMDPHYLFFLVLFAAFLGDLTNYWIGATFGDQIKFTDDAKILKRSHLERTEQFYDKYGGSTIVIARFVPFVRTFAPFIAGLARMRYFRFFIYNIAGGVLWSGILIYSGYFFGNIEIVRENFSLVVFVVIVLSLLPALVEYYQQKRS